MGHVAVAVPEMAPSSEKMNTKLYETGQNGWFHTMACIKPSWLPSGTVSVRHYHLFTDARMQIYQAFSENLFAISLMSAGLNSHCLRLIFSLQSK